MAARIRKGDTVVVIAGADKGSRGEVLRVMPKENRAVVQGVDDRAPRTPSRAAWASPAASSSRRRRSICPT